MPLLTSSLSSRFMSIPFVNTTVLCCSNILRLKGTIITAILYICSCCWSGIINGYKSNRQIIHDFSFLLQVGFNACSFKTVNPHGLMNAMSALELECFTSSESVWLCYSSSEILTQKGFEIVVVHNTSHVLLRWTKPLVFFHHCSHRSYIQS